MRSTSILLLFILSVALAYSDDLVTRDGKVYHDYKILGHDAGFITIMYSDGGGKIPLGELPDELQQKYGYNKVQADAFVQASIAQDRQDRKAIAREEERQETQVATRVTVEAKPSSSVDSTSSNAAQNTTAVTAISPPSSPAAVPGTGSGVSQMSQDDIDADETQIGELTMDVNSMLRQAVQAADGAPLSDGQIHLGGFADMVSSDKEKINQLKDRLRADNELFAQLNPPLAIGEIEAAYAKITDLRKDVSALEFDSDYTNNGNLKGPNGEKIIQENAEIGRLEDRLTLNWRKTQVFRLSQDQITAMEAQVHDLESEIKSLISTNDNPGTRRPSDDKIIEDKTKNEELTAELAAWGS